MNDPTVLTKALWPQSNFQSQRNEFTQFIEIVVGFNWGNFDNMIVHFKEQVPCGRMSRETILFSSTLLKGMNKALSSWKTAALANLLYYINKFCTGIVLAYFGTF